MENFTAWNPTRLVFGKGVLAGLAKEIKPYGENVLIIYGKESAKKNGIFKQVVDIIESSGRKVFEFGGIKSNPLSTDAEKAKQLAVEKNIDLIIAIGGGSVVDTSKLVALCSPANDNVWKVMKFEVKPKKALPLFCILTLAATGTEMNSFAVLQNPATGEKIGFGSPFIYPAVSFLDPTYTITVPADYTAYGIADIFAHSLEAYFGEGDAPMSDRIVFSILKEIIETGPALLNDLQNYTLRERILWASTCGLNGTTLHGRKSGDWGVHDLGHTLSFLYDIPHGASLTIAYPAWMKHLKTKLKPRLEKLGKEVFGNADADETIKNISNYFSQIQCPTTIKPFCPAFNKEEYVKLLIKNNVSGMNYKLEAEDLEKIACLMV